jgi:hypothetical protein
MVETAGFADQGGAVAGGAEDAGLRAQYSYQFIFRMHLFWG